MEQGGQVTFQPEWHFDDVLALVCIFALMA